MTQPITIKTAGKWIYQALTTNAAVSAIVGSKVFPFKTDEPQRLPWIVWDNMSIGYERTKDGAEATQISASILCASATVDASYELADAIVGAVNNIDGCVVTRIQGSYDTSVGMIQEITINIDL